MTKVREKRKKSRVRLTRKDVYDILTMVFIGASVVLAVWRFLPVATRMWQAIKDLGLSIAFYGTEIFGFEGLITPTVGEIPNDISSILPMDWATFKAKFAEFSRLLIDKSNLIGFFGVLFYVLYKILLILAIFAPVIALFALLVYLIYRQPNNDYERQTLPLRVFLKIEKVCKPIKDFVAGYVVYLKTYKLPRRLLASVWFYNLNLMTVIIEAFAYLFYFCIAFFNVESVYAQVVKLVMDLTVAVDFLPWWLLAWIGWKCFDGMRRKIGMAFLYHYENSNRNFLEQYVGALFLVGKQRAKKTTIITDMGLTQETIFRENALEKLKIRDKQFPHFPWQELEIFFRKAQAKGKLPTLASCRNFIRELRYAFELSVCGATAQAKAMRRHYKKEYSYKWRDLIFGYDYERYGLTYNDNLTLINVFEAIEAYLQLFYIYSAPTTLLFGNYAIRTDLIWADYGNFPVFDNNFFNRAPEEMQELSQYSHVAIMDCWRLLKFHNETDPYKDGFEVGVLNMMEMAKERGNQNTNAGVSAGDSGVNAKNDGWELNMKMQTHASTIDNYTFFRLLLDDQRADSLGADNKDLCDVILIKSVSDTKIVMPFFMIETGLYKLATGIYERIYYRLRYLRGDANNTLFIYLLKKLYNPIFKHYDRISKQFTVQTAKLKIWDAMQDEVLNDNGKYYISWKKTYSDRFATDGIKQFYHTKAMRSAYGLNDFPQYNGKYITVEEMERSGSLFYGKAINAFYRSQMAQQQAKTKPKRNRS